MHFQFYQFIWPNITDEDSGWAEVYSKAFQIWAVHTGNQEVAHSRVEERRASPDLHKRGLCSCLTSREFCWHRGPTSITSKRAKWWADSWAGVFYSMLRRVVNTREMNLTLLLYISDSNLDSFFKYASNNKNVYFLKKLQ